MAERIRVAHVIPSLQAGGAESTLLKVIKHTRSAKLEHEVFTLLDTSGPIGDELQRLDIRLDGMDMSRRRPHPLAVVRLAAQLRQARPDIVHTWMYHADLIGGIASTLSRQRPQVVWSLRRTLDIDNTPPRTVLVARACALLSARLPARIVSCGENVSRSHVAVGYAPHKMHVIPNGFDTHALSPSRSLRQEFRREIGASPDTPVIGLVGRYDPVKDHATFVAAAARLRTIRPGAKFVLCGRGATRENADLIRLLDRHGIRPHFRLLGERRDLASIYSGLDVNTLCSRTEGFPNVIAEAMACGTPCVGTNVGETATIIGDTGLLTEPGDVDGLVTAWLRLLDEPSELASIRKARARQSIVERYSIDVVAEAYRRMYMSLVMDTE